MLTDRLLYEAMEEGCPYIHQTRLESVLDVAEGLRESQNLSLSAIGRKLTGEAKVKSKIKKVDRLEGNTKLHKELSGLYKGLSNFVFKYISQDEVLPIIVDLCFMMDDRGIQMLSAEIATKGRSIPLYREVFTEGELKGRANNFLRQLSLNIPKDREVIIIMDAGFYEDWLQAVESFGWYWVLRVRQGKSVKIGENDWRSIKDWVPDIGKRTANHAKVLLTKKHKHACRIVTTRKDLKGRKAKVSRGRTTSKIASGMYSAAAKEPWILATNLPASYKGPQVVNLYAKRMQIEESFRDVKSHQLGLGARYIQTKCTYRWSVKMLLAAIVQITYWVIGVIGHSQGMQQLFQANTVKDKKVFSYFTLGKLIIEHDKLNEIKYNKRELSDVIHDELARNW